MLRVAAPNRGPQDSPKLWGLCVCHHRHPRYVPYPVRSAGEFLIQARGPPDNPPTAPHRTPPTAGRPSFCLPRLR